VRSSAAFGKDNEESAVSRIGKQPINVPAGVTVSLNGQVFNAKSSKGELSVPFSGKMKVKIDGTTVTVEPVVEEKGIGALWGLTRALLNNAVVGLSTGWERILELYGVGYKAEVKNKNLDLQIGQSHPLVIQPPDGIVFESGVEAVEGQNVQVVRIKGIDKQLVGQTAATIRAIKPPEPYKGKGIRYRGEYVRRKAGKATG